GVGKTTLVETLACALARSPGRFKRVVEVSLRQLCQRAKRRSELSEVFRQLTEALAAHPRTLLFIADLHVAYELDLEPAIDALAVRLGRPILAEGEEGAVESMLESVPGFESYVTLVRVEEPSSDEARALGVAWAKSMAPDGEPWTRVVTEEALDGALEIARRFEVRDRLPRTLLQPLRELQAHANGGPVTFDAVVDRTASSAGLPRTLVDPRVEIDLDDLERRIGRSVVGQDDALRALVDAVGLFKAGLADTRRPLGAYLFTGPTGVGKTEAVRALARELLGDERSILRLNMADHQGEGSAYSLFGRPWDQTSGGRRGLLTRLVAGRGFGVLLLDEFEKAHPLVKDHFMQLLDEGNFVNGAGEVIACKSFLIVATSNAGAEVWKRRSIGFDGRCDAAALEAEVLVALRRHFRVELLNRFDRIVPFAPLGRADVEEIARRELVGLGERQGCTRRGLRVEFSSEVAPWVARVGYDLERGARPLRRVVERRVATALARAVFRTPARATLRVRIEDGGVQVDGAQTAGAS
ncbi:MAG: AAA family ATPase, partial [Planctomycetota bacterium]